MLYVYGEQWARNTLNMHKYDEPRYTTDNRLVYAPITFKWRRVTYGVSPPLCVLLITRKKVYFFFSFEYIVLDWIECALMYAASFGYIQNCQLP